MLALYSNIKKRRCELNMSQSELANKVGYTDRSMITKIEKGEVDLAQSKIELLAKALMTTSPALMGWNNQNDVNISENSSPTEIDLIAKFRQLDSYGKEAVKAIIDVEYRRTKETESSNIMKIPLADSSLSAGTGNLLLADTYELIEVDGNKYPGADVAFKVTGNSMEPKYIDGDIIYIHKQPTIEIGEIGAFLYNGEQYIKQLTKDEDVYKLHSLNPNYPDIAVENELIIYGKVIN